MPQCTSHFNIIFPWIFKHLVTTVWRFPDGKSHLQTRRKEGYRKNKKDEKIFESFVFVFLLIFLEREIKKTSIMP